MSNKGIGKGLAALLGNMKEEETIAEKSESAVSREIMNVDISLIDTNPYQPRKVFDKAALEELAASIKTFGIIQPLIVLRSGNRYVIIAGERRFRGATCRSYLGAVRRKGTYPARNERNRPYRKPST